MGMPPLEVEAPVDEGGEADIPALAAGSTTVVASRPRRRRSGLAFWLGYLLNRRAFGLVLPEGAAHGAVQVGALATQTDVKTTWPDGSITMPHAALLAGPPTTSSRTPGWEPSWSACSPRCSSRARSTAPAPPPW